MVTDLFTGADPSAADPLLDKLRLATLGTYDIAGELGRGGMAIVYVGRDLKLQRTVAIKVMDPRLAFAQGMAERFLQEARIAAHLQHPNIIVVHDIKQNEDLIFFVMSLIDGGALNEICTDDAPLSIDQIRWVLLQAGRALAHAHSENIIHRDVKPANILVNVKGDVILTDFGIAKALGGNGMTKSGTQIGTPTYMSPEQFGSGVIGPASDQYALGVTAYQLLTGTPPFTGELYQLIAAHGSKTPVPIRELRPDCPPFLANAVMRMLEKRPEQRWPSIDDLLGVFAAGMAMDGGPARRQLAVRATTLQRERIDSIAALSAKAPTSPVPTNAVRPRVQKIEPAERVLVTLSPPSATIFVGGGLDLAAHLTMESGEPLVNAAVSWTSTDTSIVSVNSMGRVEGVSPGAATVQATVRGTSERATIRVEPAPIARITLHDSSVTIVCGDVLRAAAAAVDVNGVSRPEIALQYTSRNPAIASVDSTGAVRALTPGDTAIDVTVGNVRRQLQVSIVQRPIAALRIHADTKRLELGDASALTLEALDDLGNVAPLPLVYWSSSAPDVIHIDSAGTALAIGAGSSEITARAGTLFATVILESVETPIGRIAMTIAASTVEAGENVPIDLRVWGTDGSTHSASGVRVWSVAPHIATIDDDQGMLCAVAPGVVEVRARAEGRGDVAEVSAMVTVTPVAVTTIAVAPAAVDVEVGNSVQLVASCLARNGKTIDDAQTLWRSTNERVATVGDDGTVRGLNVGVTEIRVRATSPNGLVVETVVPVRVQRARAVRVTVVSDRTTLPAGESTDLTVAAWDNAGGEVSDFTPTWNCDDAATLDVSRSGRVRALKPGRALVTVQVDGKSASVAITVVAAPLRSLRINPPTEDTLVGVPFTLVVEATDTSGSVVKPSMRWSAEPVDAVQVSSDGQITVQRAGRFTLRASLADGGVTGGVHDAWITIDARAPRVQAITLDATALSLKVGKRRVVNATIAMERSLDARAYPILWSSSDDTILKSEGGGAFVAVSVGDARIVAQAGDKSATASTTVVAPSAPFKIAGVRYAVGAILIAALSAGVWTITHRSSAPVGVSPAGGDKPTDSISATAVGARGASVAVAPPTPASTAPTQESLKSATAGSTTPLPDAPKDSVRRTVTPATIAPEPSVAKRKADSVQNAAKRKTDSTRAYEASKRDEDARVAAQVRERTRLDSIKVADSVRSAAASRASKTAPPITELPNVADVTASAERFVENVQRGASTNAEFRKFMDGIRPSITLLPSSVSIISQEAGRVRAQFDVKLSSFNGGGVQQCRVARVTVEAAGKRGAAELHNEQVGAPSKVSCR